MMHTLFLLLLLLLAAAVKFKNFKEPTGMTVGIWIWLSNFALMNKKICESFPINEIKIESIGQIRLQNQL